ncbi:N-acetyl-gamma-glutamyl-phosphate reductase [Clostridium sp. DL1XJH146]
MIDVGIIGATGYAGQQLLWLLINHKEVSIEFIASNSFAGEKYSSIYENYEGIFDQNCIAIEEVKEKLDSIDVLFLAMPHGKSFDITKEALNKGVKVIDIGADYRLEDKEVYEQWYKVEHKLPELLEKAVYGLCEINREKIKNKNLIANPGCYTTASILALYPLMAEKLIDKDSIIIDAKSGVTGAGRKANIGTHYTECNETIKAYGIGTHRHTPEIEQELGKAYGEKVILNFTPHLVPMNRGIISTCYGKLVGEYTEEELYKIYEKYYGNEKFIRIKKELPQTKLVRGSNYCDIGLKVDKRTNRVIVVSCIDNLMKGAASQAVQNMNIIFGFNEEEGIDMVPMYL